ncbi:Ig-like domain-containing protein [Brevibacillus ginsengisoli]|uniref:Ig-like domain-containing protein n=1 Tax=Brevibacillus ginsengisoli TaxID=363854 RepID=UPI003CF8A4E8
MFKFLKPLLCFALLLNIVFMSNVYAADSNELSKEEKIRIIQEKLNTGKNLNRFDSKLVKNPSYKSILKSSLKNESKAASNLYLTSIDPTDGQNNVPRNKIVTLNLNTNIKFGSGDISIWAWDTFKEFPIKATIVGSTLYIYPQGNLDSNTQYMVDLEQDAIRTTDDKNYNSDFYYSFITGTDITPMVTSTSPVDGDMKASTSGKITFTYDKAITLVNNSKIVMLDENGKAVNFTAAFSDKTLTVTTKSKLKTNTAYAIGVAAGALSDSNKISNQDYILAFKTGSSDSDSNTPPSNASVTIIKGMTNKLKLSGGTTPYTVSSSDKSIVTATVKSSSLEIKGVNVGNATVVVKDKDGKEIDIKVEVIDNTLKF